MQPENSTESGPLLFEEMLQIPTPPLAKGPSQLTAPSSQISSSINSILNPSAMPQYFYSSSTTLPDWHTLSNTPMSSSMPVTPLNDQHGTGLNKLVMNDSNLLNMLPESDHSKQPQIKPTDLGESSTGGISDYMKSILNPSYPIPMSFSQFNQSLKRQGPIELSKPQSTSNQLMPPPPQSLFNQWMPSFSIPIQGQAPQQQFLTLQTPANSNGNSPASFLSSYMSNAAMKSSFLQHIDSAQPHNASEPSLAHSPVVVKLDPIVHKRKRADRGKTDVPKKKYQCNFPGCNKIFPRLYNLKSHFLCHTG